MADPAEEPNIVARPDAMEQRYSEALAQYEAWFAAKYPDFELAEVYRRKIKGEAPTTFRLGDRVAKRTGSSWHGRIVGTYSTSLTPEGYCVESEREPGSVQIYPAAALRRVNDDR